MGGIVGDGASQALSRILETILQLPWLNTNAGGIFLVDADSKQLKLSAEVNFSDFIKKTCSTLDYGHCLCGRVAESAKLLHAPCIDDRYENQYEGMDDHGLYVLPIKIQDHLLGVISLYLDVNHTYDDNEIRVLENFAGIIALQIHNTQIHQEKQLADLILANSAHGVIVTDQNKKILWVNKAFEKVSGYVREEVLGETPAILSSGKQDAAFYTTMWGKINETGFWEGEVWNRNKDGEIYAEWLNIVALKNDQGEVLRYAGIFLDLTPLKSAEDKIHQLAYYDRLTELPNIFLLKENLDALIASAKRNHEHVVLFNLDLDYFKDINEGLGRDIGDGVLKIVASNILEFMPGNALVSRVDGDEFIVVLPMAHASREELVAKIGKLAAGLNEHMLLPIDYSGHEIRPSCSIGIACYPDSAADSSTLIKHTSIALTHSKSVCRGHFQFYDERLEQASSYRFQLGVGISHAIERNELFLVYQPQIDRQGCVIGAEVLLRWESGEFGLIPPDVFIGIAEERNVILDIGRWVFSKTLEQMKEWKASGLCASGTFKRLAINVSPHQILSENAIDEFIELCQTSGLSAESIEIEITETGMMNFSDNIIGRLNQLHDNGFSIAIDDFGTGFSSLARLNHFPVSILKVDRSFVWQIVDDPAQAAIVEYIINMAHALDMQIVAEGVEDEAQRDMLRDFGCDIFQGYYYSKPLSAKDFQAFLVGRNSEMKIGNE